MAIRYYDEAITNKIKKWAENTKSTILSPADSTRLFQIVDYKENDKPLDLPLISISRDPTIDIISTAKRALTYDGAHISATKDYSKVLNAIPIKLSYQLDIYTRYFDEADEYLRNFIFNIINYPNLTIEIPYNGEKILHSSTMILESSISDNSDIKERLIQGQFYRMTLKIFIDDAWLFSIPIEENWTIKETISDEGILK